MPKAKKRLSKKAKAAQKILENSKLLATSKEITEAKAEQAFKPTDSPVKTSEAHKVRPDKKRG